MLSNEERAMVDKGWTMILIIWVALIFSLFIYAIVGYILKDNIAPGLADNVPMDMIRNSLFGISVLTVVLIWFLRKFLLQKLFSPDKARVAADDVSRPVVGQHPVVQRYLLVILVSSALAESIGIYGLLLCLLGGQVSDLIVLVMLSAFTMLIFRPRKDELESLISASRLRE